jgi:hypothetical protein
MSEITETPRRANVATLLHMLHEERMANASRPSREDRPSFALKRSTASGSLGVVAIDVNVPVCEEYDTAEKAMKAAVEFMDALQKHYPLPEIIGKAK